MSEWLVPPPGHDDWEAVSVALDYTALIPGIPVLYQKTVSDTCVCTMVCYLDSKQAWQSLAPQALRRLLQYIYSNMVAAGQACVERPEAWLRMDFGVKQCINALGAASEACADVFTVLLALDSCLQIKPCLWSFTAPLCSNLLNLPYCCTHLRCIHEPASITFASVPVVCNNF